MSVAQLRYQLETLQDADAKGHRMAWKVLYANRSQPLLVSTDLPSAQHAIRFFIRNPLLRLWGKAALRLDNWMPQLGLLPTLRLNTFPARSEEHTSELQSLMRISYAVFCLKKKKKHNHSSLFTYK